ncbi:MAG TPA: type II toxin-antitoxin system prevent-host-death family antitoxin [Desulfatiglandales bacterium]|nr:type II toxin-antitoxin system prevent-host-death family antitoxin [Desulfatiglandales bacterium]
MISVGVRELKENLSRYLKRVKSGERILITDRKKELAIIVPYRIDREEEEILNLIQRGIAHWNGGKPTGMASRIASRGKTVSEAVLEDRR